VRRLNAQTAAALPAERVPHYDRSRLAPGIVHIGVGGFHRSHEAMYVDRLLAAGATGWGICGVGTQPADRRMQQVLGDQDCLYTLLLKHPDGRREAQVMGSMVEYRYAPDDAAAVIERMAACSTRVVSLTITEGGYQVDLARRSFQPLEPAVLLDLEPGAVPQTVFGLVTAALAQRRARGAGGLTILSCDNIPGNGAVARAAVGGFAERVDPALAEWIHENVAFPSSMVDRITPATTDADVALVSELLGVRDAWPVVAEPFHQWVLQDTPGVGRPPWEQVGVQVVPDVEPYELMKLRLLNAGHQVIGYLGYLAGYRYADEVLTDPVFRELLFEYMQQEAIPTLPAVPGVDLAAYSRTLVERFGSPYMRDTLERLCAESSDRISTFLVPVIDAQLRNGGDITRASLVVAAWARYAAGVDEDGEPIVVVDRLLELVRSAAESARREPVAFLTALPSLRALADHPRFVEMFTTHLRMLRDRGARATVTATLTAG
jgi:mannitol 2-dehydrogenase